MKLTKMMMMGIIMALLLTPTAVFAEENENHEEWREFRLTQVLEHTPENYDEWVRLFDAKETLKSDREVLKSEMTELVETVWKPYIESLKGEVKELVKEYAEELRAQVEAGDITRETAETLFEAYKVEARADLEAMKVDRETEKAENEAEKLYYDGLRDERSAFNESIKLLVESGETDDLDELLNSILSINQLLEIHAIDVNNRIEEKIIEIESL